MSSEFKFFNAIFIFIVLIFIGTIVFKGYYFINAKNNNKKVYEIRVNNFNEIETYMTNDYTKEKESNCISFKDEIGIKRVVCNNYTITEY